MTKINSSGGAQAVVRAIHLLKSFNDETPEWHINELAEATQLNRSTAYRLLSTLEQENLLSRNPESNAYRLGPAMIALGGTALRQNDLRHLARPALKKLAEVTGETTTLEILSEGQVLVLDEVSSGYLLGTNRFVGLRLPIHATSTGKAMLAWLPTDEQKAILHQPLKAHTSHTITQTEALQANLDKIRQQGYALSLQEIEAGFVAIGAALRNVDGYPVAAISVDGPSLRLGEDRLPEIGRLVQHTAERISAQLGFYVK